jgi:hypothetical protein
MQSPVGGGTDGTSSRFDKYLLDLFSHFARVDNHGGRLRRDGYEAKAGPHLVKSKFLHKDKLISPGTTKGMLHRLEREIIGLKSLSIFQGIELGEYYFIHRSVQQCT